MDQLEKLVKETYICNSGSYSMAIKLSKAQAAAIKWFIDNFLDESSKYDCILAEEYAEEVEE
jgi:hypothetical protein